jgi:hypothetical protein
MWLQDTQPEIHTHQPKRTRGVVSAVCRLGKEHKPGVVSHNYILKLRHTRQQ